MPGYFASRDRSSWWNEMKFTFTGEFAEFVDRLIREGDDAG